MRIDRWPAEWEPHAATWLAWPHNPNTWPGRLEHAQREFVEFARTVAAFEPVRLLAGGAARRQAEAALADLPNVTLHDVATNDAWVRDYGPLFLARARCVNFRFNSWGEKYPPWDWDDAAAARIAEIAGYETRRMVVVLEGGAIEGSGAGDLLTTSRCVLSASRNADMTRKRFESLMRETLGVERVHWLDRGGIPGDDTDGHIDQLARFVAPDTIVAAWCDNAREERFTELAAMHDELADLRRADGAAFRIHKLPLPGPFSVNGQRVPASYCNFVFVNGGVIVPQFGDQADARAIRVLSELLPGREVIGRPSRELAWGLGSFHCLSMQQPA